jgi:hypothetical protein
MAPEDRPAPSLALMRLVLELMNAERWARGQPLPALPLREAQRRANKERARHGNRRKQ